MRTGAGLYLENNLGMVETSRLGPPRDRRRSRRYLTAANFRRSIVAAAIVFTGVSVYSELRAPDRDARGRLYDRRTITANDIVREAPPAITEAPITESAAPDPLSLDALQRERVLGVDRSDDYADDLQVVTPSVGDGAGRYTTNEPLLGWDRGPREQKAKIGIEGGPGGLRVVKR